MTRESPCLVRQPSRRLGSCQKMVAARHRRRGHWAPRRTSARGPRALTAAGANRFGITPPCLRWRYARTDGGSPRVRRTGRVLGRGDRPGAFTLDECGTSLAFSLDVSADRLGRLGRDFEGPRLGTGVSPGRSELTGSQQVEGVIGLQLVAPTTSTRFPVCDIRQGISCRQAPMQRI